jgi:MauM/NapG family ferredoxin protein
LLAGRAWQPAMTWALVTLAATLLVGRVWCGWICPLGALLEWVSFRAGRSNGRRISPRLRLVKYALLAILLVMAFFGSLTLLVFDPLTLLSRAAISAVLPALNFALTGAERSAYAYEILRPLVDGLEAGLRGGILPVEQQSFRGGLAILALLLGLLALNLLAERFWCRYLCPLGALLGWLAKFSLFRPAPGAACSGCSACALACKPGAIRTVEKGAAEHSAVDIEVLPSECTVCLDCLAVCARQGMGFEAAPVDKLRIAMIDKKIQSLLPGKEPFDLSRRQFLQTALVGAAGAALLPLERGLRAHDARLLRPPGAGDEAAFLAACLRCGLCLNVCPTNALQPSLGEAGLEGLWTPLFTPRQGGCDYGCNACGQICPSAAIPALALEAKRLQVLGKASLDRNRCLPWASNIPCIVCEEMCPLPEKAIRLEVVQAANAAGEPMELQRPLVLRELCIGCGLCENHCPLEGPAAVRVYGPAPA